MPSASSSRRRLLLLLWLALGGLVGLAQADKAGVGKGVYLTVEEALGLAFKDCEVKKDTEYLTKAQRKRAAKLAEVPIPSGVVRPYRAYDKKGKLVGTAYFDKHRVRTHAETLMVVVDLRGRVSRIELLAFAEPEEYVPKTGWYGQFIGRPLDDELHLKRGIRGIAGATLTARATTQAVRRVLALHQVLQETEAETESEPGP